MNNFIRVPYGVIRRVGDLLPSFHFIKNQTVRRNVCYSLQSLYFFGWIIRSVNVYGPIKSNLYKTGIIFINMIIEAMTREYLQKNSTQPAKKHSSNIKKLENLNIPKGLIKNLITLNERRRSIHLHLVTNLEVDEYTPRDWEIAIQCLEEALKSFQGH